LEKKIKSWFEHTIPKTTKSYNERLNYRNTEARNNVFYFLFQVVGMSQIISFKKSDILAIFICLSNERIEIAYNVFTRIMVSSPDFLGVFFDVISNNIPCFIVRAIVSYQEFPIRKSLMQNRFNRFCNEFLVVISSGDDGDERH
jgi:hypothetical protein